MSYISEQNMEVFFVVFLWDKSFVFHTASDQHTGELESIIIVFEVPSAYLLFFIEQSAAGD